MIDSVKKHKLLLLGGSNSIDDIKKFAETNNLTLVATAHPRYGITPLKAIADESYDVNAIDVEGLVQLVKEKNISAIFPGCNETVLPYAISVAEACGLPIYTNRRSWDTCADKSQFKKMCSEAGIPVAKTYSKENLDQISKYPVVVKPADSSGSHGFSICHSKEDVISAIEKALPFSRTQNVLIEDYIPFNSSIIHYTISSGKAIFCGISDKKSMLLGEDTGSVMALQTFPSADTEKYLQALDSKVKNMFENAGLKEGPLWIEAFNDHGEFVFNEMGYRFGGSMTYYPVRYFYNFDQLELMLKYALGENVEPNACTSLIRTDVPKGKKYAILPLHVKAGTIKEIKGEKDLQANPNIYAYVPIHFVGDTVKGDASVQQVFCYLHILFDEESDLIDTVDSVLNSLSVTSDNGEPLLFCLYKFKK